MKITPCALAQGYLLGESKGAEPRGRPQGQRPVVRNFLYKFFLIFRREYFRKIFP